MIKPGTTLILAREAFPRSPQAKAIEHARQIACSILAGKLFAPGAASSPESRLRQLLDSALEMAREGRPPRWPAGSAVRVDLVDLTEGRFPWYRVSTADRGGEHWLRPEDLEGATPVEGEVN